MPATVGHLRLSHPGGLARRRWSQDERVLDPTTFEAFPGDRTRVTFHSVYQSVADRDGTIRGDVERGVNDSYERLDGLLASSME